MASDQDIAEVIDEFVDDLNISRLHNEAERLDISIEDLLIRILNEAKERINS